MDFLSIIWGCADYRLHKNRQGRDFIKELSDRLGGQHYFIGFPGTTHFLSNPDPKTGKLHADAFLFGARLLISDRKEGEFILFPHGACAALKYLQFADWIEEMKLQIQDSHRAKKIIKKEFGPGFKFREFYGKHLGEEEFETIEIAT